MLLLTLAACEPTVLTEYVDVCDTADTAEHNAESGAETGGDSAWDSAEETGETGGTDETGEPTETGNGDDTGETGDSDEPADTGALDACAREPQTIEQIGNLAADTLWCAADTVTLFGPVSVPAGFTLTIEAGTTIHATFSGVDPASLVIESGAWIYADGTPAAPIVLAPLGGDPDAGELNGIEIFGLSTGKRYPEGIADDSSGSVQYLRVEAGGPEQAVHLDSVGSGTQFSYVAVDGAADDAFEIDGGTVELHHLAVLDTEDDGVQYEDGYSGMIHHVWVKKANGSAITARNRDPDDGGDSNDEPRTQATVYNVTINNAYTQGAYYDNGGLGSLYNTVVESGGNCAFEVDDSTLENGGDVGVVLGSLILGEADLVFCNDDESGITLEGNTTALIQGDPMLDGYMPLTGSPALDAANADARFADYLGAFATEDWAAGWAEP